MLSIDTYNTKIFLFYLSLLKFTKCTKVHFYSYLFDLSLHKITLVYLSLPKFT